MALATVVVLNWNGERHLEACLRSLQDQKCEDLEVVVADNGSRDGSEAVVRAAGASWLPLFRNHGFAAGNNMAAETVEGDFLVFVNNDMRFPPDFVCKLIEPLRRDPTVFATDARQRDWGDARDVHVATYIRRIGPWEPLTARSLPLLEFKQVAASEIVRVTQACAGNMAVRRSMFLALGGFDSRLPAGWEDTEICWRAYLMGWTTLHVPDALCWHRVGGSSASPEGASMRLRGTVGGKLLFVTKHLPIEHVVLTWLAECASALRDLIWLRRGRGEERLRILLAAARQVRALIAERRRIYDQFGHSPRQHLRWMLSLSFWAERTGSPSSGGGL